MKTIQPLLILTITNGISELQTVIASFKDRHFSAALSTSMGIEVGPHT